MRSVAVALVAVTLLGCSDGAESSAGSGSGFKMVDGPLVDQEPKLGRVFGSSSTSASGQLTWLAGAFFGLNASPPECRVIQEGPCQVKTCVGEDLALALTTRHGAGDMTVDVGGTVLSLKWSGKGYGTGGKELVWVEPSTTVFSFTGDVVPAFSSTLQTPRRVVVTQPHFLDPWMACDTPAKRLSISRQQPFQVTWTGGAAGESVLVELKWETGDDSTVLECVFDAGAGSGAIPTEALSHVPVTNEAAGVLWSIVRVASLARGSAEPGGYATELRVESRSDAPEGYTVASCAQIE